MTQLTIGFGGGCHWCTEAVFGQVLGVDQVVQGWIAAHPPYDTFSEAVVVTFDDSQVALNELIDIHLRTHSSASAHSLRHKYRSAVYCYQSQQQAKVAAYLHQLNQHRAPKLITQALRLVQFKPSPPHYQRYYQKDPHKPFCQNVIQPKLDALCQSLPSKVKKPHD